MNRPSGARLSTASVWELNGYLAQIRWTARALALALGGVYFFEIENEMVRNYSHCEQYKKVSGEDRQTVHWTRLNDF